MKWSFLGAVFLPLLMLVWGAHFAVQTAPYNQLGNHDPDYAYLFNSLNITQNFVPKHIDHPGTPTQIFGSWILKGIYAYACPGDCGSIVDSVVNNSEHYLRTINLCFQVSIAIALFVFGLQAYFLTKSFPAMLFSQAALLWTFEIPSFYRKVAAEPMIIIVGLLFSAALLAVVVKKSHSLWNALVLGALAGLAIAIKLNCIPLLIFACLGASFGFAIVFVATAVLSFILGTVPIWDWYKSFYYWVHDIVFHSGRHGQGEEAIANGASILASAGNMLQGLWPFFAFIGILFSIFVWIVRRRGLDLKGRQGLGQRAFLLCFVSILLNVVLVLKHPGNWYLAPSFVLATAIFPIFWDLWANSFSVKKMGGPLLAITLCLMVIRWTETQNYIKLMSSFKNANDLVEKSLDEQSECTVVRYDSSSGIESALMFGNYWSGNRYTVPLEQAKPKFLAYSYGENKLVSWSGVLEKSREKSFFESGCVLLAGISMTDNPPPEGLERFTFEKVIETFGNGIYRMKLKKD